MKIILPSNTPILLDTTHGDYHPQSSPEHEDHPDIQIIKGQAVIQEPLTYPKYSIRGWHVLEQFEQTEKTTNNCFHRPPDKIPFVLVDGKIETDTSWWHFGELEDSVSCSFYLEQFLKKLVAQEIDWETSIPAHQGEVSYLAKLMMLWGWRIEEMEYFIRRRGRNSTYCYEIDELFFKYDLTQILNDVPSEKLEKHLVFGHRTLLDLACHYQLWTFADWLWKKGVRWSKDYIKKGQLLKVLIEGCFSLEMESNIHSFQQKDYDIDEEIKMPNNQQAQRNHVWLKTWLDRYLSLKDYPQKLKVNFRYLYHCSHWNMHQIKNPKPFLDKAVNYWVHEFFRNKKENQILEDVWLDFWFQQNIDFKSIKVYHLHQKKRIPFHDFYCYVCRQSEEKFNNLLTQQERFELKSTHHLFPAKTIQRL